MHYWTGECAVGALLVIALANELGACTVPGAGAVSDPKLTYQQRLGDRRCEGLYRARVGAQDDVALVSLTTRPITWATPHAELELRAPRTGRALAVQAVTLPRAVYYRMDAELADGTALRWPVSDVLTPAGIRSGDVGATASYADDGVVTYVPIRIAPDADARQITAIFRSRDPMTNLRWRWTPTLGTACRATGPWRSDGLSQRFDRRVAQLTVPAPAAQGVVCLEVMGEKVAPTPTPATTPTPVGSTVRIAVTP